MTLGDPPLAEPLPEDWAAAIDARRRDLGPFARSTRYFRTVGSTNDIAMRLAENQGLAAEGAVVVAEAQTAGRGRRGHTWFSPEGSGLYVSVILAPGRSVNPSRALPLLTISAGVALAEAIARSTGLQPAIKWPNDLIVGTRKLAGILAEALPVTPGAAVGPVVLGYGINVLPSSFPVELRDRVTAIETELGCAVDRLAVFAETLVRLAARYADLLEGRFDAILDAWRRLAPGCRGARVTWDESSGLRSGTTAGIDDQGALLVTTDVGTERIVAGEVFWHL